MHNTCMGLYGIVKQEMHQPVQIRLWNPQSELKFLNTSVLLGFCVQLCKFTLPVSIVRSSCVTEDKLLKTTHKLACA